MAVELIILRAVHVLGGIVWVGSGVFMAFWLAPTIQQMGPTGGQVMGGLQRRKLMTILPIIAILTILSGVRLLQITSGGFSAEYFATPMGKTYAAAGLAAILAFLVGIVFNRPIAMRMAKLQTSAASDPVSKDAIAAEVKKLQQRATSVGFIVMALLLLAALGMAVARYV